MIHLLIRELDDGAVYATSPQAPGLMIGRPGVRELRTDLADTLAFHFERPGPFTVTEHHEQHHEIAGGELVIRLAADTHAEDRRVAADRIRAALRIPEQAAQLISGPDNRVGETVYICALPTDTVGWLLAQLDPRGEAVTVAMAIGDGLLFTLPIAYGEEHLGTDGFPGVSSGATEPDATLGRIMRETPIVSPSPSTRHTRGLVYC